MKINRVLSGEEHAAMGDEAVARGMYRNDPRVFLPGMAWFMPWYFDPGGDHGRIRRGSASLSIHYWRDWADKRAPICVVCPNGEWWEIDRKSSNGDGWIVTGELPIITCAPSIVVEGYHGFLRNGEFTADIEGRGQNGVTRV